MKSQEQLLARFEFLNQLGSVARYSRDHVHRRESVLEHIGFCARYALLLGLRFKATGVDLNLQSLLIKALSHDDDEAFMGDTPRTTKYASEELAEAFKAAEFAAVDRLSKRIEGLSFEVWVDAKSGDLEGQLVKLIDTTAVVYKIWSEICLFGNISFERVLHELYHILEKQSLEGYHPTVKRFYIELKNIMHLILFVPENRAALRFDLFGVVK